MKKMTTAKKISSNRLTTKRTRKDRKRRPHVRALKFIQRKINLTNRQEATKIYFRAKRAKRVAQSMMR